MRPFALAALPPLFLLACNPPPRTLEIDDSGAEGGADDTGATIDDSAATGDDSGTATDSSTPDDTGTAPVDTGTTPPDTGDTTAPTFDPTLVVAAPTTKGFTLTWTAATDNVTPQASILYDVYVGVASKGETLNTTVTGTNTATLTTLASNTPYFVFVRARDQAGNHADTNEQSATTLVSFANDVQTLFTVNCAVPGCHVPGTPPDNLILSAGFSYSLLVNVDSADSSAAGDSPVLKRVKPSDAANSVLDRKLHGDPNPPAVYQLMPPPVTGTALTAAQKQLVRDWINQGALNN